MRIGGASRCCLAVILSAYALLAGTEARATDNASNDGAFGGASAVAFAGTGGSAGASASALSSANAFSGAFPGTASFPGAHDGHKGVRSYDNTGYTYGNDASKSYNTPWGQHGTGQHGTGQHGTGQHGTKGGDHRDYNKDGCLKCKWENDDYWERDEPEEEGDENDGDECDDGQYRPDKTHHHHGAGGPGRGHASGSRPLDVHKTGPTSVYDQGAIKGGKPSGLVSDTGYPANVVYAGTTSGFGTTPRPGSGWDSSPFAGTSKPEYDGATVRIHGTTPTGLPWPPRSTPRPSWGDGHGVTSPGSFGGSTPRPSWSNDGFANTPTTGYPTSHNPASSWHANQDNTFVGSYGSTPRPASSWNTGPTGAPTGGYPSSSKPAASWNVGHDSGFPTAGYPSSQKTPGWSSDNTPIGSYGSTPRPPPGWSGSIPTVAPITGFSSSPKPDAPWSTGHGNTPTGSFGTTPTPGQPWSADFSGKPQSNWSPDHGITGSGDAPGCTQPDISCDQEKQVPVKVSAIPTSFDDRKESLTSFGAPRGSDGAFPPSYGSSNWPYGQPGTQGISGAYAGADATVGFGSTPHAGAPDFGKKTHSFFDKPTSVSRPYGSGPYGSDQSRTTLGPSNYGPSGTFDYGKPGPHGAWSSGTTFGTTKGPQTGYSGVTRPNYYGSGTTGTTSWPSIGSSAWPGSGTTGVHARFPASNAGFGTTKSPFSHGSTPDLPSGPYSAATDTRQPGFNIASSSATANANAFATSFGAHSTPGTTGRTPPRFTTPVYTESSSYPGEKGSSESGRPIYGTTPHGVKSGIGSGGWPGGQPGSVSGTWPDQTQPSGGTGSWPRKPGSGSGIAPGTDHPGVAGGTWPGGQTTSVSGTWPSAHSTKPDVGGGSWPGGQPGAADGILPAGRPGGASGTWPGSGSTTAPDVIHPGIGAGVWPGQQPGHGTGTWPGGQPGTASGIAPAGRPGGASGIWPGSSSTISPDAIHPGIGGSIWPGRQPGHGTGTWPGGQPGTASGIAPAGRPGGASGIWPGSSSTTSPDAIHPGIGGSTWPGQQPGHGTGTWPDGQTGQGSGIGCPNRNYNCAAACSGSGGNTPATHAPCDGVTGGPSGVNKTYYPVGIGDGNVPSFTNAYEPASSFGGVTSDSAQWNPANPFLHGGAGGTPSDVSRPWGETTDKPIGQKNPFLDPSWSISKPGLVGGNVNDDRNVIPLGGDTKPFNKENPFLNGDKGRGDIEIDSIEGVRPLGGRRPEENNPFIGSSGRESAGPGIPSYAGHPIGSPGSGPSGSGSYGGVKGDDSYPRVPSHGGNIDGSYPTRGSVQGGAGPLQCKLGLFGCGTPGSGSYATTKGDKYPVGTYPSGGGIGGNVGTIGRAPGVGGGIGIGAASGSYTGGFGSGAGYPGSAGGDPAGPTGAGGRVGTYGNSFSSALASSSSFAGAKSVSSATDSAGTGNNFGPLDSGNWSSGRTRNQGGPDSWASSGASAFASSSSGNWSGNRPPIDVKG